MNRPIGLIATFYSYKGGVGRTMALVSVAVAAARRGQRVLCVDWDLEAPGLDAYVRRWRPDVDQHPGVLEFCLDRHVDWRSLVQTIEIPDIHARFDLIAAGCRDAGYADRLAGLDWRSAYEQGGLGARLEEMREEWLQAYDIILVDSRTGLSDMGGISTIHLPQVLVLLFTPNEQSLDGAARVARSCQEQQRSSRLTRGPLWVVPVPTRIDTGEKEQLDQWRARIVKEVASFVREWADGDVGDDVVANWLDRVSVPYVPFWSFGERIPAVEEERPDKLSVTYALEPVERLLRTRFAAAGELLKTMGDPTEPDRAAERPVWEPATLAELRDAASGLDPAEVYALDRYLVARMITDCGLPSDHEQTHRRLRALLRSMLGEPVDPFADYAAEHWLPPAAPRPAATWHLLQRFMEVQIAVHTLEDTYIQSAFEAIVHFEGMWSEPLLRGIIPWLHGRYLVDPHSEWLRAMALGARTFLPAEPWERWRSKIFSRWETDPDDP